MGMRACRLAAALGCATFLSIAAPKPADWVPARWPWADSASLELLSGGPVNCLLLREYNTEFVSAATARGFATLAVLTPDGDGAGKARRALASGVTGLALEGEFSDDAVAAVKRAAADAPVVEIVSRARMLRDAHATVLATNQALWPGVAIEENGGRKAGPSGSVWIDTNTGFIRAARAWSDAPLWIANEPPAGAVVTAARYRQAIADAAMSGARWVISLDGDTAARLAKRDPKALADWKSMLALAAYFEGHPEWRAMREYGGLALVQDPTRGGMVSGGILDMIAARHTPVRPVPAERLSSDALKGAAMAVNVDGDALTPEEKDVLREFTRSGGTLLNGPPGWTDHSPAGGKITLDKAELARLNDIWREVNSMVGRRNLGVRMFNASSMLSNLLVSPDGKTTVLHLVNYSDYPAEDITAQLRDSFKSATLLTPEGTRRPLEIHKNDEGGEIDIDKAPVCVTVILEQ